MKKAVMYLLLIVAVHPQTYAGTTTLDFSTGTYNSSNTIYEEDGFRVEASYGFYERRLGTLAWYEGDNIITISSAGALFNLEGLTIVDRAFAGLTFESSSGGSLSVGSIAGPLGFPGGKWDSINYFRIMKTISHFDILSEIDNISLTTVTTVPEPSSIFLIFSGLFLLWLKLGRPSPGRAEPKQELKGSDSFLHLTAPGAGAVIQCLGVSAFLCGTLFEADRFKHQYSPGTRHPGILHQERP